MENHAGRWQAAGASGPFRQLSCFEESHTEAWLSLHAYFWLHSASLLVRLFL